MRPLSDPHAFPTTAYYDERPVDTEAGMTLRDWFAGQALVGLVGGEPEALAPWSSIAKDAYNLADAMLKARLQKPEGG